MRLPDDQHRLSAEEVHQRLGAYAERMPDASSIVLGLGQRLIEEVASRTAQIDAKGISVLGWSGAVLVFLLSRGPKIYRSGSVIIMTLGTCAMGLGFIAAFCGAWALQIRRWRGISDETWLPNPVEVTDTEHLRQHYVEEFHQSRNEWDDICLRKVFWLRLGQNCLSFAAFLTILMLIYFLVVLLTATGPTATTLNDL